MSEPQKPQSGDVPKPVIGRKLESLMGKPPSSESLNPPLPGSEGKASEPGMRSLFRGHPTTSPPKRRSYVPKWYLFGADLLLVAAALIVMYKGPAPLTGNEKLFGVAAVAIGAILALIAICMKDNKEP